MEDPVQAAIGVVPEFLELAISFFFFFLKLWFSRGNGCQGAGGKLSEELSEELEVFKSPRTSASAGESPGAVHLEPPAFSDARC